MKTWSVILILIVCVLSFFLGRLSKKTDVAFNQDTIFVRDTITKPIPEPVFVVDVGEIEVPLPIVMPPTTDTIRERDTVKVYVPITRKVYQTEDYRAVISGYQPNLDSMTLYTKKEIIYKKDSRWGLGVTAGYGIGREGLSPQITVGIFYRIF